MRHEKTLAFLLLKWYALLTKKSNKYYKEKLVILQSIGIIVIRLITYLPADILVNL